MKQNKLSKRNILNVFFIIALIFLSVSTYLSYNQIYKVKDAADWVKHTEDVIRTSNQILLNIMVIESAVRGYSITHDDNFILDLDSKIAEINANLQKAKQLTVDNIEQQVLLSRLEPLVANRITIFKNEIATKNVTPHFVQQGQVLTNKIREYIKYVTDNEIALLQKREQNFLWNFNVSNILDNSISAINIILLIILIIIFNYLYSRMSASQETAEKYGSLLKGIVGGTNEYIAALDLNFKLIMFNSAFEREYRRIFGKKPYLGMNLIDGLSQVPEQQKKAREIWGRALKGEEFTVIEEFGRNPFLRKYEITYNSIYNERNELIGAFHIVRDVGTRLEEEIKLKKTNEKLQLSLHEVERQAEEMTVINEMNTRLRSSVSLEETLSMAVLYLKKLFPETCGIIYLMNHSNNYLEMIVDWNMNFENEKVFAPSDCWALRQSKIHLFLNANDNLPCGHCHSNPEVPPYMCIPLLALNEVIGVMYLQFSNAHSQSEDEIKHFYKENNILIQNLAGHIALSISNIRLNEVLKQRSTRDSLTNLYNRSYLTETFDRDLKRALRNNSPIAVLMMDIDYFKNVNDTFGHEAGDLVLVKICKEIKTLLRKTDIACRYGGEEILLILYDTVLKDAITKAEQIRESVSNLEFNLEQLLTVTVSFGVAMFPEDGESADRLIRAADIALYQSKQTGRNKVTVYSAVKDEVIQDDQKQYKSG